MFVHHQSSTTLKARLPVSYSSLLATRLLRDVAVGAGVAAVTIPVIVVGRTVVVLVVVASVAGKSISITLSISQRTTVYVLVAVVVRVPAAFADAVVVAVALGGDSREGAAVEQRQVTYLVVNATRRDVVGFSRIRVLRHGVRVCVMVTVVVRV